MSWIRSRVEIPVSYSVFLWRVLWNTILQAEAYGKNCYYLQCRSLEQTFCRHSMERLICLWSAYLRMHRQFQPCRPEAWWCRRSPGSSRDLRWDVPFCSARISVKRWGGSRADSRLCTLAVCHGGNPSRSDRCCIGSRNRICYKCAGGSIFPDDRLYPYLRNRYHLYRHV